MLVRRLSEDDVLRREYDRLQETKEQLDRRPSPRPDPAVVDRIVDAARDAASSSRPREDRPVRSPARTWSRRLQTASAALALALLVGLGWWQLPGTSEPPDPAGPTAQRTAPTENRTLDAEAVPAWDDTDELVRIHRRIERLRTRSTPDAWGTLQTVDQTRP